MAHLQRAVLAANDPAQQTAAELDRVKQAIQNGPGASFELYERARTVERRLADLRINLSGNAVQAEHSAPTPPAIIDRVPRVVGAF